MVAWKSEGACQAQSATAWIHQAVIGAVRAFQVRWTGAGFRPCAEVAAPAEGQTPEKGDKRPREDQQGRGDQHQDLVLRHVGGEEDFAQRVQRRDEREREHGPAGPEERLLARSDAARGAGAAQVEDGGHGQREDDARVEGPGGPEVVRSERLAFVREGESAAAAGARRARFMRRLRA